jgi:neutral ceramidase
MTGRFEVGYAKQDITPPIGTPLAGRPMWGARRAKAIHDSLFARAVRIESDFSHVTILSADLLLITKELHLEIARASGHSPENLLVLATHTHSGPGGYWKGSLIELFMGLYKEETRAWLVKCLSETVQAAAEALSPADLFATSLDFPGMSTNRRQTDGVTDPVLTILKFDTENGPPICIVSFGAHPIVGLEREPFAMTADYPGEVCRRLEKLGLRPMFVQGACGATSPSWFTLPLDRHLRNFGDAFEQRIRNALKELRPRMASTVSTRQIPLGITTPSSRITPDGLPGLRFLEHCMFPVKRFLDRMAKQGVVDNRDVSLTVVHLGSVILLGVPGELGPIASLSIRTFFSSAHVEQLMIASLCNGYIGYVHRKRDYRFKRKIRCLALYENAMSLAGRNAGDNILSLLERSAEVLAVAP